MIHLKNITSVQNFPDMIFRVENNLHGKHKAKPFWKQKAFVNLLFQLFKRKQDCTMVLIKIVFTNVYSTSKVFEVLLWEALFLSYTLDDKKIYSLFLKNP